MADVEATAILPPLQHSSPLVPDATDEAEYLGCSSTCTTA